MKLNETASSMQISADLILLRSPVKLIRAAPAAKLPEWGARVDIFTGLRHLSPPPSCARSSYKWLSAIMHKSNTISLSTGGASEIDGESQHQSGALWF